MRAGSEGRQPTVGESNPFATRFTRAGALPPLNDDGSPFDAAAVLATLEEAAGCGAFVGPHGSGKSTRLQACAGLQVLTVDAEVHDAADHVGTLRPDVVLFDLGAAQRDFAMTLWKAQPDLLLIGVDLATNEALVLSGQRTRAYTTEDLLQVIQRHDPGEAERG